MEKQKLNSWCPLAPRRRSPDARVGVKPKLHTHTECGPRFHPLLHTPYTVDSQTALGSRMKAIYLFFFFEDANKSSEQVTYLLTYIVTYSLTPWSKVLLEKRTVSQLVKKIPAFYGTRRFITAFTSAPHLSLSWARSIQSIPPSHFLKIHINNMYCCTVHYGIYMWFIHQQLHFLLNLEKFNFTLEHT